MMNAGLCSDYCGGNLELTVRIKIKFLNNQKDSFDISLPGKTSKNIIAVRQIQNSKL